jgi:hypothetical protein
MCVCVCVCVCLVYVHLLCMHLLFTYITTCYIHTYIFGVRTSICYLILDLHVYLEVHRLPAFTCAAQLDTYTLNLLLQPYTMYVFMYVCISVYAYVCIRGACVEVCMYVCMYVYTLGTCVEV